MMELLKGLQNVAVGQEVRHGIVACDDDIKASRCKVMQGAHIRHAKIDRQLTLLCQTASALHFDRGNIGGGDSIEEVSLWPKRYIQSNTLSKGTVHATIRERFCKLKS